MNVHSCTEQERKASVQSLLARLRQTTGRAAVIECLEAAAVLVEHAAYEIARGEDPEQVARLILTASDLERIANRYAEGRDANP